MRIMPLLEQSVYFKC